MASESDRLFSRVIEFMECHAMLHGADHVIVAVSGGPDSIALLDVLLRFSQRSSRTAKPLNIHVAHFDHRLRTESAADAEFVSTLCRERGLGCSIEASDVREAARIAKKGIEETARRLRYGFLTRLADDLGADRIAAGHTMSDQAETFLMRLIRGSGPRGLGSMRPVTTGLKGNQNGGPAGEGVPRSPLLIRPLLCITREEVEAYCMVRGLEFRIDPSNASPDFLRNRVRHSVIPLLRELNSGAIRSIARVAESAANEHDLLNSRAQQFLEDARARGTTREKRANIYSIQELQKHPSALLRTMILQAIELARAAARASGQVTSAQILAIEQLLARGKSGNRVKLAGGISVWREFDELVFTRDETAPPDTRNLVEPGARQGVMEFGGVRLTVERRQEGSLLEEARREAQLSRQRGSDWLIALLDEARLPERLVVRARREGDRGVVIGQSGTKRLKSLMIDHRIPCSRRATWPIVTTTDDLYVWSPGLPPAREFAVRADTPYFAILRALIT